MSDRPLRGSTRGLVNHHRVYLDAHMDRLRLLMKRHVLWLRHRWESDARSIHPAVVIEDAEADRLLEEANAGEELTFLGADQEAIALTQEIGVETERTSSLLAAAEADGAVPALEILADAFDLTPFERDVVVLCYALEREPSLARLYAYIQDDVGRTHATPQLAGCVFGQSTGARYDLSEVFTPQSTLRRFQLVELKNTSHELLPILSQPMRLDERMVSFLDGRNHIDERIARLLRTEPSHPVPAEHGEIIDRVLALLAERSDESPMPLINIVGSPDRGRKTLAHGILGSLGLTHFTLEASGIPSEAEAHDEFLRLLDREAILGRFGLYVEADGKQTKEAELADVVEGIGAFLIVGSQRPYQTRLQTLALLAPAVGLDSQLDLWRSAFGTGPGPSEQCLAEIVQQFDFDPETIFRTAAAAVHRAHMEASGSPSGISDADLWHACRDQVSWKLDDLAQRIHPCYTWEDIVLPDSAVAQMEEIAFQVPNRASVYRNWGFNAKLSRGRGIGVLFSGPSGTGKTMAAEILASHLDLGLHRIDLAGVVSKYIGETEKNLKKVFDAAEQSGAILFFDEADALFGQRTEVKDSHDRYANIEVNYLLQRMEDYRGLAILATNRRSALDHAFLRRLRFVVNFPFPDTDSRRKIWERVFPSEAKLEQLDFDTLARLTITGGNIRNIALNAAFLAVKDASAIGMRHIERATRCEYDKIEKLMPDGAFGSVAQ